MLGRIIVIMVHSRQMICDIGFASNMMHGKGELREEVQPTGIAACNMRFGLEVSQCSMVSINSKDFGGQKVAPFFKGILNGYKLTLSGRVVAFCIVETFGQVFNRVPSIGMLLFKDCTNSIIRCIANETSRKIMVKNFEDRG